MTLEELTAAFKKKELEKRAEVEKDIIEERQRAEIQRRHDAQERLLFNKKLELSRKILGWASAFAKTDLFARCVKLGTFYDHNKLWIYTGNWGHQLSNDDRGCWARMYLHGDGSLEYMAGYKFYGGGEKFRLTGLKS